MVVNVLEVNPERLWDSLERSAEIGRFRDVGLRRLALSAEDKEMRDLFVEWARAAGCSIEILSCGSLFDPQQASAGPVSVRGAGGRPKPHSTRPLPGAMMAGESVTP